MARRSRRRHDRRRLARLNPPPLGGRRGPLVVGAELVNEPGARAAGGTATDPQDFVYGRVASIIDPFGATFDVGARPAGQEG